MAFAYMFLVEGWRTGIPKMYEAAKKYGLKEPEIITQGNSFRVNLFSREAKSSEKIENEPDNVTERQSEILSLTTAPMISQENTAMKLGVTRRTIARDLDDLRRNGKLTAMVVITVDNGL